MLRATAVGGAGGVAARANLRGIEQTVCYFTCMVRGYRLGRRTASVDRTSAAILDAARALVAAGPASAVSVGAVARRAGVSRITIYNRFGSKEALLRAIVPKPPPDGTHLPPATDPREAVRQILVEACARWASDP